MDFTMMYLYVFSFVSKTLKTNFIAGKMDQPNHSSSYTHRKVSGIKLDLVCIWGKINYLHSKEKLFKKFSNV